MILIALGILFVLFLIISIILFLLNLIFKNKIFRDLNIGLWLLFISIPVILLIESFLNSKTNVEKEDIYGNYIINRNKCKGKQADWQYNHYRFKITNDNKIYFYVTDKERIVKSFTGKIEINSYSNPSTLFKINFEEPIFHILQENPTLYRETWTYYYVLHSQKYGNMFFTKGNWENIN